MLHAALISNALAGLDDAFVSNEHIHYRTETIGPMWAPDLSADELVIAPNGTDHVALWGARDRIRAHLDHGGALACFCGWFTAWVPGNRWIHDNTHPTREVELRLVSDQRGLFNGVDLAKLNVNRHGIRGWWACGYIEPAPGAEVLLADTWDRAIVVLDETTTNGPQFLTASGPLGDYRRDGDPDGLSRLYLNLIAHLASRHLTQSLPL